MSANSNLSEVASFTYELTNNNSVSSVLDGIHGKHCNGNNVYSSFSEENPWLEVTWPVTITIWRKMFYNGVDGHGKYCSIWIRRKPIAYFFFFGNF